MGHWKFTDFFLKEQVPSPPSSKTKAITKKKQLNKKYKINFGPLESIEFGCPFNDIYL